MKASRKTQLTRPTNPLKPLIASPERTGIISDYILAFERAYNKAAKHGMTLPTSVQAYRF